MNEVLTLEEALRLNYGLASYMLPAVMQGRCVFCDKKLQDSKDFTQCVIINIVTLCEDDENMSASTWHSCDGCAAGKNGDDVLLQFRHLMNKNVGYDYFNREMRLLDIAQPNSQS